MGEMVTIPVEEYRRLLSMAEAVADAAAFDRAVEALALGDEELLPAEFVRRLVAGATPLSVWREHRGLTKSELARISGVNRVQITNIESGNRTGSLETLRKLATGLGVSLDDLA